MNNKQRHNIQNIIRRLDSELETEKCCKYEEQLFKELDKEIPNCLYKFRSGLNEYDIENFREDKLFLNSPRNFNDPTECMVYVNPGSIMNSVLSPPVQALSFGDSPGLSVSERLVESAKIGNIAINTVNAIRDRVKLICLSESLESRYLS